MANLITNIREWFDRPTRSEIMTLARKATSKQGLKVTAQLLQQTDTLTKKGHCGLAQCPPDGY